jgi:hypothetical protein
MVQGYNLKELKEWLRLGSKIFDFAIGDFEGEVLFYHKNNQVGVIKKYQERIVFINKETIKVKE